MWLSSGHWRRLGSPGRAYCAAARSAKGRYRDAVIYSVLRDEVKLEDSASEDGTA
jgi:hypothetical protein